jgi:hypothetical protein
MCIASSTSAKGLIWHLIPFHLASTDNVSDEYSIVADKQVDAAPCFFAEGDYAGMEVFAFSVVHEKEGDTLFVGGISLPLTKLDMGPITNNGADRIRVKLPKLQCIYRPGNIQQGALLFRYETIGSKKIKLALVMVEIQGQKAPLARIVGTFDKTEDAIKQAEKLIPTGTFKPDKGEKPIGMWLNFFQPGEQEFCLEDFIPGYTPCGE